MRPTANFMLCALYLSAVALFPSSSEAMDRYDILDRASIIPKYEPSGANRAPVEDFDGDGLVDAALSYRNFVTNSIHIYGLLSNGQWGTKQSILVGEQTISSISVASYVTGSTPHIVVALERKLYLYSGWPLRLDRTIQVIADNFPDVLLRVAAGDVDADGEIEIVVTVASSQEDLKVFSSTTGELVWESRVSSYSIGPILLAQLDSDPALEMLVGSHDLYAIDGATKAVEWFYPQDWVREIIPGRFGGETPRFASSGSMLNVFRTNPIGWLGGSSIPVYNGITATDVNADGIDEVVAPYGTGVVIIDGSSLEILEKIGRGDVRQVAAGDFNGDGRIDLLLATRPTSNANALLDVVDAQSGAIVETESADIQGDYLPVLIKTAETTSLVFSSGQNSTLPAMVRSVDLLSGREIWRTPAFPDGHPLYRFSVRVLLPVPASGDAPSMIVGAGRSWWSSEASLFALHATTGNIIWTTALPTLKFPLQAGVLLDADDDGTLDEIILCTSESRLHRYRLSDRSEVWRSSLLPGMGCRELFAARNGSISIFAVVMSDMIIAFDSISHQQLWSIETASFGASFIKNGAVQGSSEIASFDGNVIRFYDFYSRELNRSIQLSDNRLITAVLQPEHGSIHEILVAQENKLAMIDGISGAVLATKGDLGDLVGVGNHLQSLTLAPKKYLAAVGAGAGVFAFDVAADRIFSAGFE